MSTDHLYVLDLHDASGTTGYRMEWNVVTGDFDVHMFEDGVPTFCGHSQVADQGEVEYMLTTAYSVATAVRDDLEMGFVREAFCDGYAKVNALGLDMDFDLHDPSSNEVVTCSLFHDCAGTGELVQAVQFNLTIAELEEAVSGILPLVIHEHRKLIGWVPRT